MISRPTPDPEETDKRRVTIGQPFTGDGTENAARIMTPYRHTVAVLVLVTILALTVGCSRDNGLPRDLATHLAAYDITVEILGSDAPMSSRAGMVFFDTDPAVEQTIVAALRLMPADPSSSEFEEIAGRVTERPAMLWGVSGRPPQLELRDGGQFEYLYLLRTAEGRTYLIAEYAYG